MLQPSSQPTVTEVASLPFVPIITRSEPFGDWRDDLRKDGFVVVPAIPACEAKAYAAQALEWLAAVSPGYNPEDPSTFTNAHTCVSFRGGMIKNYGISHEQWVWDLRTHPAVNAVFEKIWGTGELITSFDCGSIMLPGGKNGATDLGHWEHIDQSPFRLGYYNTQGLMNLEVNGPDDGGLLVLKGSSQLMQEFFDQFPRFKQDGTTSVPNWGRVDTFMFSDYEVDWFLSRGCGWVKPCPNPGDLILWDSRTMHHNQPPSGNRVRICTYICQGPASIVTEEDKKLRAHAFKHYQGTTHNPFANIYPRDHQPELRWETGLADPLDTGIPVKPVKHTDRVLQLAGILGY